MTISVFAVESLRVIVESTFGADASSSPGLASFTYVPLNEGSGSLTITTNEVDPNFVVQRRSQGREKVLGARSWALKFAMNLAPTGTAASSAVTAVTSALGIHLKACMGGEHLGTGTTFVTGWTAITGDVTSAAGLVAGGWIGWSNASGVVEWRQIKSLTSNTVVLSHGFTGSPTNLQVCYSAATYYFTEALDQSLQYLVSGQESDDRWLCTGGQVTGGFSMAIDASGAAIPTIEFTCTGSWYFESDETAASVTGTLPLATYSAYSPIVGNAGEFRMFTVGTPTTVTSTRIHVSALAFTPKIAVTAVTSPSGANGGTIYRYQGTRAMPPVEGSFTTFFENLDWWVARDAKQDRCMQHTIGTTGGQAVVLAAPTVQPLNPQRSVSGEGIAGLTAMWAGRHNTDTAVTTEIAVSPVIVVLG